MVVKLNVMHFYNAVTYCAYVRYIKTSTQTSCHINSCMLLLNIIVTVFLITTIKHCVTFIHFQSQILFSIRRHIAAPYCPGSRPVVFKSSSGFRWDFLSEHAHFVLCSYLVLIPDHIWINFMGCRISYVTLLRKFAGKYLSWARVWNDLERPPFLHSVSPHLPASYFGEYYRFNMWNKHDMSLILWSFIDFALLQWVLRIQMGCMNVYCLL